MELPPGIIYLAQRLPKFLLLPVSFYLLAIAIHVPLSTIFLILLSTLSIPITFTVSVFYTDYIDQRRAAALGAVLPPRLSSKWPGGLPLLRKMVDNFRMGKPGTVYITKPCPCQF